MKVFREPFSYEHLENIRRIRKVRRLFKQIPLFAYAMVKAELPSYTYTQFLNDLKFKKSKQKKSTKSPLTRYGRYYKMNMLLEYYKNTGDIDSGLKAIQLRKLMTKPYRVIVRKNGQTMEFCLSPLIPYSTIEKLVQELYSCNSLKDAEEYYLEFKKQAHIL